MNALHPTDLLAAFALDALTADERASVLAHLGGCASCRGEVARFRSVTEVLEMSVTPETPPSPDLRARILQASAQTPQVRQVRRIVPDRRRITWSSRVVGWLAAAVLFATTLGLGAWNWSLQQQIQVLAQRPTAQVALAATPDAPGANGVLSIDSGRGTLISVSNLPQLASGQVYEAWVIDSTGAHPSGTFVTTSDGHGAVVLTYPAGLGQVVAITAEPTPGTAAPTGKILLKGTAQPPPGT